MAALGQAPERGPVRRQEMIERRAVDAKHRPTTLPGRSHVSTDWSILTFSGDLGQHSLVPLVDIRIGQARGRGEAPEIAKVRPHVAKTCSVPC
jgi:hypothetical protein